jgi:hypothetical protein
MGVENNVTKRSGRGKWITKIIQVDPVEIDMLRFDNIDDYRGIQAPISIHEESIQPTTIVGGFIVAPIYLVVDHMSNEEEDDGTDNTLEHSSTSCDNDD